MPKTKRKAQDVPMLIKLFELGWFHLKKALRPFSSKSSVRSPKKRFRKGDHWKRNTIIAISTISTIMVVSLIGFYAFFGRNYYDNSRAIKMLNSNARTYSNGLCAMYVRSAIEHGGAPTYGFPGNACDYVDFLPRLDFDKIADETTRDYKPQAGDIMVFAAQKGHKSGHIAMWNGKMWVSDFRQPRGMWVHPIYKSNPSWSVFRRPDGWAYRYISFSEMCALIRYLPTTTRNAIRRWHSEPNSK